MFRLTDWTYKLLREKTRFADFFLQYQGEVILRVAKGWRPVAFLGGHVLGSVHYALLIQPVF